MTVILAYETFNHFKAFFALHKQPMPERYEQAPRREPPEEPKKVTLAQTVKRKGGRPPKTPHKDLDWLEKDAIADINRRVDNLGIGVDESEPSFSQAHDDMYGGDKSVENLVRRKGRD